MRGNRLILVPLCLLLCWMLPVSSKKISYISSQPKADFGLRMSMVENAVDDMYFGCIESMTELVKDRYFKKEIKEQGFANVWNHAEQCAIRNLRDKDKGDEALTKDHMQAICVYTSDYEKFYKTYNHAVRTSRKIYATSFPFHSLHFWMTSAVQILSNNKGCRTTYRRTQVKLTGKVNKLIRFGFFASSSYRTDMNQFGNKTCFKIKTCLGAFLNKYSALGKHEEEVLIPPYEMFKIIGKKKGRYVEGLHDCKDVYTLESAGSHTNLNCNVAYFP
ncbi:ecto-ADP-ribosyltransferase 5-like [Pempheris klunzingeri]|uniref:ecto-ADP-ribosyltransferase 5-like n=1 Tax=Pempheris klunzingeri TaxID=3127111 RepID=UPI0039803527